MTTLILIARLLLAGTFLVSAVAKIRDREGSRAGVEGFGVPVSLVPVVAVLLPVAELTCAALLLVADPGATLGAAASVLLLLAFTAAIVWNLVQGRKPDCHCFGQLSNAPTGWRTVARNGVLLVLAVLPLTRAGDLPAVTSVIADYSAAEVALGVVLAVLTAGLVVLGLLHRELVTRYGSLLLRLDEVESRLGIVVRPPTPAPPFALPDLDGVTVDLTEVLGDGRPALVVFISPGCSLCSELVPDLETWQSPDSPLAVLVLSTGPEDANREKIGPGSTLRVALQQDDEVGAAYGLEGTPGAFLVGAEGLLAGAPAYGVEPIRDLHDRIVQAMSGAGTDPSLHQIGQRPMGAGDPLPETTVVDETGTEHDLAEVAGDDAVVLFWRSDCGYCAGIVEDVVAAERTTPVVVVTTSSVGEIRSTGITSPVYNEAGSGLWTALQVPGTPSAVRVSAGLLASSVAVGGPDVLALLGRNRVHTH